jgi:DNA-binding NarL/FixJ family response regulator
MRLVMVSTLDYQDNIKIVIAQENRIFREGLSVALRRQESMKIVGEATNKDQIAHVIGNLKPDILLLDFVITETNGLDIISTIREKSSRTKTIVLSTVWEESKIFSALKLGAKGFLSKDATISDLVKAIEVVNRGELWIQRKLISKFFDGMNETNPKHIEQPKGTENGLTQREKEVLRYLTQGITNKEIGQALSISEKTVRSHLNNIFKKLNVTRRLEAILYAIKKGL